VVSEFQACDVGFIEFWVNFSLQNWATKYVLNAIGHTKEIGHFIRKDPSHQRLAKTLLVYWAACGWDGGPT
jgi:hypothetical protein